MSRVVAICGKGGVGKTTISAIAARVLAGRTCVKSLMVDADPAAGLETALGFKVKKTINDARTRTIREIQKGESDDRDLAQGIDYYLMEALAERGGQGFLSIGRPEEVGCYCSVNSLLREAIEILARRFDVTVIDAEAGIEQVNRKVMGAVDYLLLVSDLSMKSLRVAETIAKVAGRVSGQKEHGLVVNRAKTEAEALAAAGRTDLPFAGWIPESKEVRDFDGEARSFFELPDCEAARAVEEILKGAALLEEKPI